jgi:hypothetical protein
MLWPTPIGLADSLSPGHTALYGLIMAKASENVISREEDKIRQLDSLFLFIFLFLIPTLNKKYLI